MWVKFKKTFEKQYSKLGGRVKNSFEKKLEILFETWELIRSKNEYVPSLNNHSLNWKLKDYRSINVEHDIRAIFRFEEDVITFYMIWSHAKLYW